MKYVVIFLKIATIILLIKAGYSDTGSSDFYEMLRWVILGSFAYFSWFSHSRKNIGWTIFFVFGALLFNPFKHARFGKETWAYINYTFALIVVVSIVFEFWNEGKIRAIVITERMIYREAVILASCIVILGATWGFIAIRNSYYEHNMDLERDKINNVQSTIDKLPTDYAWKVYNEMIPIFSEKYLVDADTFVVNTERVPLFYKSYPNAKKIAIIGVFQPYQESKLLTKYIGKNKVTDPKMVAELNNGWSDSDIPVVYDVKTESANEIYWNSIPDVSAKSNTTPPTSIPAKEYDELFTEYLYTPITWEQFQKAITVNSYIYHIPQVVNHDISKPYLLKGIGYSQSTVDEKERLTKEIYSYNSTLNNFQNLKVSEESKMQFLYRLGIAIFILVFAIRYVWRCIIIRIKANRLIRES